MYYRIKDIVYLFYDSRKEVTILVDTKNRKYHEDGNCVAVLSRLCQRYGATLESRKQLAKQLTKGRCKLPIMVSETNQVIFFPINAYDAKENIWIQYVHVKKLNHHGSACSLLFSNGERLRIKMHPRTLQKQLRRCRILYQFLANL